MNHRRLRRPLAVATVAAAGTLVLVGATVATASHGGTGSALTASNGSPTITISGGGTLTSIATVTDAQWSPDGCRALYVSGAFENFAFDQDLATVRYDDGDNVWFVADGDLDFDHNPEFDREHPSWRGDGADVVWSERDAGTVGPKRLMMTSSSYGWTPFQLGPLDDDGYPVADGMTYTHPDAGPGRLVVFQRDTDVVLYNPNLAPTWNARITLIETNAANPALSPDGSKVVYVQGGDIWTEQLSDGGKTQVTTDVAANDNPVWSHDGATIAFSIGSDIYTAPAGGGSPTSTSLSGEPAYRSSFPNQVVRLSGANRFATAIAVSKSHWATDNDPLDGRAEAGAVVLSRSDTFADALSGSALAAAKEGPLLMTPPTFLESATKAEITRILGNNPSKTVYILGGLGAMSQAVQDEIEDVMGLNVVRLAGANRFATSTAIADEITTTPDLILAATGLNFPDALAAGAAAGSYNLPGTGLKAVVVLTADTALPTDTLNYLNAKMTNPNTLLFGIGGQAATATATFGGIEVVGTSRYETALFTAEVFFGGEAYAGIATGANWPDALAGGALMGTLNGPLLLTPTGTPTLNPDTQFLLDVTCGSINTGFIFGGTGVVHGAIDDKIGTWISGPAGFDKASNPTGPGATASFARSAQATERLANPSGNQRTLAELKSSAGSINKR